MPARISLALTIVVAMLAAVPAGAAAKTLVRYDKTGGIAGVQVQVTVSTTGAVRIEDRRQHAPRRKVLTARRLSTLRAALRDARFSTLRRRYAPTVQVSDGFLQTVRYAGRTVTVETESRPPARLRKVLGLLDGLAG